MPAGSVRQLRLLDLPTEVLLKVLCSLPAQDLLRTTLVASPFHRLVSEHVYLRYILACWKHGVVDAHPPFDVAPDGDGYRRRNWTTAEKLERLVEREHNWLELQSPSVTIGIDGAYPMSIYELQAGVYVRGADYVTAPGSAYERPQALEVYPLPSAESIQSGGGEYRKVDVGMQMLSFDCGPYLDLTLKPEENLIVIIQRFDPKRHDVQHEYDCRRSVSPPEERAGSVGPGGSEQGSDEACACGRPSYALHLLGMDGLPRTDIAASVLFLDVADPDGPGFGDDDFDQTTIPPARFLLQICGDTLAVMVSGAEEGERNVIHSWDWRTGQDICTYAYLSHEAPEFHFTSFLLLSPTSCVLTYLAPTSAMPSLQLFDIAHSEARHLSTLELPKLNAGLLRLPIPIALELRPDPPSSASERLWGPQLDGSSNGATRPFATDPDRGLISLDITVGDQPYHFHLLKETLTKELAWGSEGRLRTWDEWGPKACRAWQGFARRQWVTHTHGYRILQVFPSSEPADDDDEDGTLTARELRLFDFNPLHFPTPDGPEDPWFYNTKPNFVFRRQIFDADITTELPFRTAVVSSLSSRRTLGVMLDEERIITTLAANDGVSWHFVCQGM